MMTTLAALVLTASWADGGLALDEIEDVIAFHDAELTDCVKGKTKGSPVMQFGISGDGGVLWNSVLRDSKPERAVCFSKQFRTWAFPPRPADTRLQLEWTPALRQPMPKPPGDGGLEQSELASVQLDHRVEVARCVQQFRKLPANDGTFSNAVVIGPSGVVVSATTDDVSMRLAGTEVPACVLEALPRWRFPRSTQWTAATLEWVVAATAERVEVLRPAGNPLAVGISDADAQARLSGAPPFAQQMLALAVQLEPCRNEPDADAGVVRLSFRVDADGGLAEVNTDEDRRSQCVAARARGWRLQPPDTVGGWFIEEFVFADDGIIVRPFTGAGGLDKDVIMKVIRANQQQIRACYEFELQKRAFGGKLAVAWSIGADGAVINVAAAEDTLGAPEVTACVIARIRRWVFSAPAGGGVVNVTFPWIFKMAGE